MIAPIHIPQPKTQDLKHVIDQFLSGNGWIAPADAMMRAAETLIWRNFTFSHPILEIGCGDGSVSQYLYKHLDRIDMGADLNPDKALSTGLYKKTQAADARQLPFAAHSYQTVLSNSTFEHIDEDLKAVSEVARVLKKGGEFWVTVPAPTLKQEFRYFLNNDAMFLQVNSRFAHYHYRSTTSWEREFSKVGLQLISAQRYFSPAAVQTLLRLFRIATFHVYKRELWSYLSEERFNRYLPVSVIRAIEKQILLSTLSGNIQHSAGAWQLLRAVKI